MRPAPPRRSPTLVPGGSDDAEVARDFSIEAISLSFRVRRLDGRQPPEVASTRSPARVENHRFNGILHAARDAAQPPAALLDGEWREEEAFVESRTRRCGRSRAVRGTGSGRTALVFFRPVPSARSTPQSRRIRLWLHDAVAEHQRVPGSKCVPHTLARWRGRVRYRPPSTKRPLVNVGVSRQGLVKTDPVGPESVSVREPRVRSCPTYPPERVGLLGARPPAGTLNVQKPLTERRRTPPRSASHLATFRSSKK